MALSDFFTGAGPTAEHIQQYTPEQQSAFSALLQRGMGGIGQQKPVSFQPIAERARKQFQEQTIPSIAERFTAMGLQDSGYFPQILGSAASDLESQLAALGSQFDLQQQQFGHQQTMDYLRQGTTPQFISYIQPGTPGLLQQSIPAAMSSLTGGAGLASSGLQALISLLSQLFQKRA